MNKMQTLTIGGNTYQIYDSEAARIDDSAVGQTTWSSRTIADRLCPSFTAEGDIVSCQPVAGYPLSVVSSITPVQEGTPSPQAPCPIGGSTAVQLTLSNEENCTQYAADLGQAVYCGRFNWDTGLLILTHKLLTLTGSESAGVWKISGTDVYTTGLVNDHEKTGQAIQGWSSHAPRNTNVPGTVDTTYINHANKNIGGLSFNKLVDNWGLAESTVDAWMAFLAQQHAAGTPVQILYKLGTPLTVQLEEQEIPALFGVNTLQSDTGDTTVTGRADPGVLLQKLMDNFVGEDT